MRTSTKVLLIINVIALATTAVLFPALLTVLSYQPAFTISFTTQSIVALTFCIIWLITGGILFVRFLRRMSFPRKLFFVTITYTGVFALVVFSLLNISSINYAPVAQIRNVSGLGTNMTIVYVLVGVVTALFIVALSFTFRRMSKPIKKINIILSQMNSDVHIPNNYKLGTSREFSLIANNLVALDKKITNQEKLLKLANDEYEKIVPKEFLKHLGVKSYQELQSGNNTQREVTTLFCDLKNSTEKSASLTPVENFKFINDYLNIISPIVAKNRGFIDKYLGDGILAVFSNAQNALNCSRDIIKDINLKNKQMALPYQIEVKIGIHTGDVVFGVVGNEKRKSPTIISETVNYTAKMQEVNEIYGTKVILSKKSIEKVKGNFRYVGLLNFDKSRLAIYEYIDVYPMTEMKSIIKNKERFEQAVRLYEDGKIQSAKQLFDEVSDNCPNDNLTQAYVDMCQNKKSLNNS